MRRVLQGVRITHMDGAGEIHVPHLHLILVAQRSARFCRDGVFHTTAHALDQLSVQPMDLSARVFALCTRLTNVCGRSAQIIMQPMDHALLSVWWLVDGALLAAALVIPLEVHRRHAQWDVCRRMDGAVMILALTLLE